jgi:hypothetical protein
MNFIYKMNESPGGGVGGGAVPEQVSALKTL